MSGIFNVLGKIADQFQGRTERLKNERDRLIKERKNILKGDCNEKTSIRLVAIDNRIDELNVLLGNAAK